MKTLMDFIVDLSAILKESNDPSMRMQLASAKNDLKQRVDKLTREGYALPQLYAKYGANILRAQIIDANNKIQQANKEGEYRVADLLDEDKILQRLSPDVQEKRQELTDALQYIGFDVKGMPSDLVEKLQKATGSEDFSELRDRIGASAQQRQDRLGEIEDIKEEQKEQREAAIEQRIADDKLQRVVNITTAIRKTINKQKREELQKQLAEALKTERIDQGYRENIGPEISDDLDAMIKAFEEEKKKPLDPGKLNIKVQERAKSGERVQEAKQEKKQAKDLEEEKEEDVLSERDKANLNTAIDSLTQKTSTIQQEIQKYPKLKKLIITSDIKSLKDIASGILMTKKGDNVSFKKKDIDANTKILIAASKAAQDQELKKKIEDILEVYK